MKVDVAKKETNLWVLPINIAENVGKVCNFKVGVYVGYSNPDGGYGLPQSRFFIPEKWFGYDYAERRKKCLIPEDVTNQTKCLGLAR